MMLSEGNIKQDEIEMGLLMCLDVGQVGTPARRWKRLCRSVLPCGMLYSPCMVIECRST
jgi:hypothetical protein